jgi:hypothetical protein
MKAAATRKPGPYRVMTEGLGENAAGAQMLRNCRFRPLLHGSDVRRHRAAAFFVMSNEAGTMTLQGRYAAIERFPIC